MCSRILLLGSFCLLFLSISASFALESVPIEGRILVSAGEMSGGPYTYFIEGMSDNLSSPGPAFLYAELSPDMERIAYHTADGLPATTADVWIARLDGSEAVNVTELAGVGGVNCKPVWSPDGSQLAFQHADPTAELYPCQVGLHVWVVNTDGTDAHQVTPPGTAMTWSPAWSANGYRVFCSLLGVGAITIDTDGTDMTVLPNVGDMADWSPDGKHIISATAYEAVEGGQNGAWRGLLLTDADGGDPQVLYEHFLSDADAAEHIAIYQDLMVEGEEMRHMREGVGPSFPDWSPRGDRILFRAAIPFDPSGLFYPYQNDLWLYDLTDHTMIPITQDTICEFYHSWNGPNTFPEDPEVTVDDVTVTFSEVNGEGVTTIMRDDDPPEAPTGFIFDYEFYELNTTAEVTGPVTICMTYTDGEVPPAAEDDLAILHYDEQEQMWEDITTSRDTVSNTICGQTDGLSPFALQGIRRTRFPDVPAWGFGAEGLDPHWAYYQVMACVDAGIVGGYLDGLYHPTTQVSRGQMAVFIARSIAGGDENVPDGECTEPPFADVDCDHWARKYIAYCVDAGVVDGYQDGSYGLTGLVDRGQMSVFISRAVAGGDESVPDGPPAATFDDVPTDHWAYKYVEYCVDNGIVGGYSPTTYAPGVTVTRDQMAVFICRGSDLPM
jgi:Tol biopolymer transport system component